MFVKNEIMRDIPCKACLSPQNIQFVEEEYMKMSNSEQIEIQKELRTLFERFDEWDDDLKKALGYFSKDFLTGLGIIR